VHHEIQSEICRQDSVDGTFLPSSAKGVLDDRAGARAYVDADADGRCRDDDVGEEDGGVRAVAAHWLERELGDQLGLSDGLEDAPGAPQGPVLGERATRLTHEPHRDPLDGQAPAGAHEHRVVVSREGNRGKAEGPGVVGWSGRGHGLDATARRDQARSGVGRPGWPVARVA